MLDVLINEAVIDSEQATELPGVKLFQCSSSSASAGCVLILANTGFAMCHRAHSTHQCTKLQAPTSS